MLAADHILDLGPGAGVGGGHLVAQGTPAEIIANPKSVTGDFLSGREEVGIHSAGRAGNGDALTLIGARGNNLQNLNLTLPLGCFVAITGVSGSGKSSLVLQTLLPALRKAKDPVEYRREQPLSFHELRGGEHLDKIIPINQRPIGRTPRSNPATYSGLFTELRELFAKLPEAQVLGFGPGRFSFNVKGGRCESCQGGGVLRIEMHFLPDLFVTCEHCEGKRYNAQTLSVTYRGRSVADVLAMSILEARELLGAFPKICRRLDTLVDVGLGYIALGQPATTLSGGEAQRIKLAKELSRRDHGRTLYLLDEPTTGLHFDDIRKLLGVLHRLTERGNSVVVIEHNLDVIRSADHVIDLGPEGGAAGGKIVATGSPRELADDPASVTGVFLKQLFDRERARSTQP